MANTEKLIFENDKATSEWLDSQKKSTKATYKSLWKEFLAYTGMTGDQILESKRQDKEWLWEKKIEEFNSEMRKIHSSNRVRTMIGCVRGFFTYHRQPLVFRRNEAKKLRASARTTSDYAFQKEELYRMWQMGDVTDRYIISSKCMGLRAIDFCALKRQDLETYLDREVPISIGEINTIKEGIVAQVFLDVDAVEAIRNMIQLLNSKGKTSPETLMLDFGKNELSARLQRLAEKAGIKSNGKLVKFHCLRKFLFNHLCSVMATEKAKQIIGKQINEEAYLNTESLRQDFQRVLPLISFDLHNSVSSEVQRLKETVENQETHIEMLEHGYDVEKAKTKKALEALKAKMEKTVEVFDIIIEKLRKMPPETPLTKEIMREVTEELKKKP